MFCELMEVASSWFAQHKYVPKSKKESFTASSDALFRDSRAEEASSAILVQMNRYVALAAPRVSLAHPLRAMAMAMKPTWAHLESIQWLFLSYFSSSEFIISC